MVTQDKSYVVPRGKGATRQTIGKDYGKETHIIELRPNYRQQQYTSEEWTGTANHEKQG